MGTSITNEAKINRMYNQIMLMEKHIAKLHEGSNLRNIFIKGVAKRENAIEHLKKAKHIVTNQELRDKFGSMLHW